MNRKLLKNGFTLVELMAFFIFISLMLAASTPIITKRVRDLPKKINHGMYICYRNQAGSLIQEYYNASRQVSRETVTSCHFDAPRSVAMFKIDVIGAGAGGYDYYDVVSEADPRSGSYHLDGSLTNNTIEPSNEQLRELMQGQEITRSVYTGAGGKGYGMRFSYAPPVNLRCTTNSGNYYPSVPYCAKALEGEGENAVCPEGWTNKYADVMSRYYDMISAIRTNSSLNPSKGYKTYIASVDAATLNTFCSTYGLGSVSDVAYTYGTVSGTSGGDGKYLVADYRIDLSGVTNVKSFLSNVVSNFVTGSSSYSGGSGFSTSAPRSGTNHSTYRTFEGSLGVIWPPEASTGGNVERFAAIKLPDGSFVTNAKRATGGDDVRMRINSSTGILQFYDQEDGEPASGVVFSNSSSASNVGVSLSNNSTSSYTPSVTITMALKKRVHKVGNGGGAGAHEVAYVSTLGEGCDLIVPHGGAAIDESIDVGDLGNMADDLNTTISCGEGGFSLTAVGGNYNKSFTSKDHRIYDYNFDPPAYYQTSGTSGAESTFDVGTNVFTRYFAANAAVGYGAGGDGVSVKDTCTAPQGSYSMTSGGREVGEDYSDIVCNNSEVLTVTHAENGNGGAVLIAW